MQVTTTTTTSAASAGGPPATDAAGFGELFAALLDGEVTDGTGMASEAGGAAESEADPGADCDSCDPARAASLALAASAVLPAPDDDRARVDVTAERPAAPVQLEPEPAEQALGEAVGEGRAPADSAVTAGWPDLRRTETQADPPPVADGGAPSAVDEDSSAAREAALEPPGAPGESQPVRPGDVAAPVAGAAVAVADRRPPGGTPDPSGWERPQGEPAVASAALARAGMEDAAGGPARSTDASRPTGADGRDPLPEAPMTAAATGAATPAEIQGGEPPAADAAVDARAAELARRVAQAAEQLEHRPPPRRVVVELDGLRLAVTLRGDEVRVAVLGREPSGAGQWGEDLRRALDAHGFSFDDRGGREERSDQRDGRDERRRVTPSTAPAHPNPTRRADDGVRL